jgi:pimeloyl-ACP methyl ester carboxylesterase
MSGRTLVRVGAALIVLFVATPSSAARAHGGEPGSVRGGSSANPTVDGGVVERQVVFDVTDANTSGVPCTSDGSPYQVHGTLVAPASAGTRAAPITVYLHGFNVAGWMWNFKAVDGYDYAAAMARRGHVSLVLDRLGYLPSGQPGGTQTCFGAEAAILHQIVQRLRTGSYAIQGAAPKPFPRVVTAGQDVGGVVAEVEAYSYKDIDGLALLGWADQGFTSDVVLRWSSEVVSLCASGGRPAQEGGPGGYFQFIQSDEEIRTKAFPYAEPAVVDAIMRMKVKNPCGDFQSINAALTVDMARLHEVDVPVLNLYPDHDLVITPQGYRLQGLNFAPNDDVTTIGIQGGHFPMLERLPSRVFQADVSEWLHKKGFS